MKSKVIGLKVSVSNTSRREAQHSNGLIERTPFLFDSSSPELLSALDKALNPENNVITERQADLIHQVFFLGKKISQIAKEEGHSPNTIRAGVNQALLKISRYFDESEFVVLNTRFDFRRFLNLP
jgi:DNA-directed RNA polymerase specialized sigma24 family protein